MSKTQRRLLASFLFSIACIIGTHVWYKSGKSLSLDYGDRKPVAQLVEAINEVQKKPLKRLIWQSLSENDSLYGGEQIRTTANAEARIQILKTGTIIALEPESLIVLEENDGQLSLDFLKGNLFVKGGTGSGADQLQLKSGNKQIALGGADASFGKGSGDALDVQVFNGKVDGVAATKDPFDIVMPLPQSEVHVLPDGKDRVAFEWRKQFTQGTNVVLEMGKSRSDLKARTDAQLAGQKLSTKLAPGDYYWRLVAQDPNNKQAAPIVSNVYKVRILPKRPPIPIMPEKDMAVATPDKTNKVTFKWANPGKLSDVLVEVADSEDFKKTVDRQQSKENDFVDITLPKSGVYYWRVVGYIGKNHEAVMSPIQKFSLAVGGMLTPPVLELPVRGDKVSFQSLKQKGLFLQWKPLSIAKSYRVVLKEKASRGTASAAQPHEEVVPVPQLRLTDVKAGEYEWSVTAIGPEDKESKMSEVWNFSIEEMPIMSWKDGKTEGSYLYTSEKPELGAEWSMGPKGTVTYRVKIRKDGTTEDKEVAQVVKDPAVKAKVPEEGRFIASVEALNKDNQVIARTQDRLVDVKMLPLLGAPQYSEELANPVKSQRNGNVEVSWKSVEGAKNYVVQITDSKGKPVKEEKTSSTRIGLSKMLPGEYAVTLKAVDQTGRPGAASESRQILVPETSDVRAPKVMKIKVE